MPPTTTPRTATAPSERPGYEAARQSWLKAPSVDGSADQNIPLDHTITDLTSRLRTDESTSGYRAAIATLRKFAEIPDAMVTPAERGRANIEVSALDSFFGTPGIWGPDGLCSEGAPCT